MLFNSIEFMACFLPMGLLAYFYIAKNGGKQAAKVVLILTSIVFYGWISVKLAWVLALSVFANYFITYTC